MRLTSLLLALAASLSFSTAAISQQGSFSPVLQINDAVITGYEMEQRIRFLTLLRFPGDIPAEAEKGLLEDRLRMQAANDAGIKVTPEQIEGGLAEFAGRANLETEQFLAAIAQGGVAPETFRDFVEAGLAWRQYAAARFGPRVQITDAQIDAEISADNNRGAGPRVLISEIIIPGQLGSMRQANALAQEIIETATSEAAFAEAARKYSIAASREQGGQVDWIPITNLPPMVRAAISTLGQGQLTEPVPLENGVGVFRLRGFQGGAQEARPKVSPATIAVDYALMALPAGSDAQAELTRIRGEADTCEDLYRIGKGMTSEQLQRHNLLRGKVPGAILAVLDGLDTNEAALLQTTGGARSVVMLCERNATRTEINLTTSDSVAEAPAIVAEGAPVEPVIPSVVPDVGFGLGPSRAQIAVDLRNRRVSQMAEAFLAALKADAIIRRP
ncbi:MAG: peptidylprolyl isomerase [Albidovulum sp.]